MVRTDFVVNPRPHAAAAVGGEAPLAEHAMVRLSAPAESHDGRQLQIGACGAIVFVHGAGAAYEVEFIAPFHAVVTVSAADLSPADAA